MMVTLVNWIYYYIQDKDIGKQKLIFISINGRVRVDVLHVSVLSVWNILVKKICWVVFFYLRECIIIHHALLHIKFAQKKYFVLPRALCPGVLCSYVM